MTSIDTNFVDLTLLVLCLNARASPNFVVDVSDSPPKYFYLFIQASLVLFLK